MNAVSRAAVRCTRCSSSGISGGDGACDACGGSGLLQRLVVPMKIVAVTDFVPAVDMRFQRLVVTSAEPAGNGKVVLRGFTDRGILLVAAVPEERFRHISTVDFVEEGASWPR